MDKKIKIIEKRFAQVQKNLIKNFCMHDSITSKKITNWRYKDGGGGKSCLLTSKNIYEKAMINFSSIKGKNLPNSAHKEKNKINNISFHAIGVSVVVHPQNPFVPCSHFNIRFFVTRDNKA